MQEVACGTIATQDSLLKRSRLPDVALHPIFESEETGLFHLKLEGRPVGIGHDEIMTLVLCLDGKMALIETGEETLLESGSYAVIEEGRACTLVDRGGPAEALVFFGFEQLPGAFFNSYGPANV